MTDIQPPKAVPGPLHPEQVNPLGAAFEQATPQERRLMRVFALALVASLVLIPILAVLTLSPLLNVFIGLLPLLFTLIIDIIVTARHYRAVTYWLVLILVHVLALAVIYLLNLLLDPKLDVIGSVGVSFQLAILATALAWLLGEKHHKTRHVVEFKEDKLPEYVQSIEDKAKALNFAIGRVYRMSNGGTAAMRERLRIPKEWYNEFYAITDLEQQKKDAKVLVHKIHDRLKLLAKKEKEVFSESEVARLKNLARNKHGEDAIIDVLKTNDRDPVQHYYVSAVDLCERILEELR